MKVPEEAINIGHRVITGNLCHSSLQRVHSRRLKYLLLALCIYRKQTNKQKKFVTLKLKTNFKTKAHIFPRSDAEKAYSPFQRELRRRPSHTASRVLCKAMAKMQLVSGQLPQV